MLLADSGIVTGAFTIGGVAITALAAFWLDWRRQKREDRTRWDKERLLVYPEFLTEAKAQVQALQVKQLVDMRALEDVYSRAAILASPLVEDRMQDAMISLRVFADACKR